MFDVGISFIESLAYRLFGNFLLYSCTAKSVSIYYSTDGLLEGASRFWEMSITSFTGSGVGTFYPFDFILFESTDTLSLISSLFLRSTSLSSVEESSSQGLCKGLKFLDFQFVRTKPRAFAKLEPKF
jgi:hypothetical protein